MMLKKLSAEEMTRIREFLDGMPDVLTENWQDRMQVFATLLPDKACFLQGIHHMLIVPDGWISYVLIS
jgi:hypothetical protein